MSEIIQTSQSDESLCFGGRDYKGQILYLENHEGKILAHTFIDDTRQRVLNSGTMDFAAILNHHYTIWEKKLGGKEQLATSNFCVINETQIVANSVIETIAEDLTQVTLNAGNNSPIILDVSEEFRDRVANLDLRSIKAQKTPSRN